MGFEPRVGVRGSGRVARRNPDRKRCGSGQTHTRSSPTLVLLGGSLRVDDLGFPEDDVALLIHKYTTVSP